MKNCSKNLRRFPAIEGMVFFFFPLEQQTVHHSITILLPGGSELQERLIKCPPKVFASTWVY